MYEMLSGTEWLWIVGAIVFMALIELLSRTPAWPRVVKFLGGPDPDYPKPPMNEGEIILREGRVEFVRGLHGVGVTGVMLLTNRRVIWYDDRAYILWPFKRISGEYPLNGIASTDQTSPLEHIFGGQRLRIRLRNGKDKCFWVEGLDDWIRSIRLAIAGVRNNPTPVPSRPARL